MIWCHPYNTPIPQAYPVLFFSEFLLTRQVRVVRKIPADFKDAFEAAVGALRRLGKIDVAIDAVAKVAMPR